MSENANTGFATAPLQWDAQDRPRSVLYGDIYFSNADAVGESTHVFVEGNRLSARWRELQQAHFTIGEIGFGSGLNFMNSFRLWCSTAPSGATLHYLACELHPLTREDMARLHRQWPELANYSAALLPICPIPAAGVHQRVLQFGAHRVCLTLLYGDAGAMLRTLTVTNGFRCDAWFLDGFAPRLNPALWNAELLQAVAGLSHFGTSLSSYSVAAEFRHHLNASGFSLAKLPGYAQKRHMLAAQYEIADPAQTMRAGSQRRLCVIGGGLAGCSTARAFADSGWQVTLLEKGSSLAPGGSGNPQGILHCKPGKQDTVQNRFNLHAFMHAAAHYAALAKDAGLQWHGCGMLQLAVTDELEQRFAALAQSGLYAPEVMQWLTSTAASTLAGMPLMHPALYFPQSGWLSPPELCAVYCASPNISVMNDTEVVGLDADAGTWRLSTNTGTNVTADLVVVCNSADAHTFAQTRHYPLISNRGQVDVYPGSAESALQMVLCGQGYAVPGHNGQQSVGGSYFVGDHSAAATALRSARHLQQLAQFSSTVAGALTHQSPVLQRSATRCITPDRMPLTGVVRDAQGQAIPGLYVNLAHGSHGLTRTPLCAAWLASLCNGTPPPLPVAVSNVFDPGRYVVG